MALQNRVLRTSSTEAAKLRCVATLTKPVKFAADAGASAVTLQPLHPLAYNTSTGFWVAWATGGANETGTIRGFVWPHPVTIKATGGGEVLGTIMVKGEVHYADIVVSGGTLAQLVAALKVSPATGMSLRNLGIDVMGLEDVR